MKNYHPVLIILIIVLMLSCSAGCSSKDASPQRESLERPAVPITQPLTNADHPSAQTARSIPTPPMTRQLVSPGSTIPAPTGTIGSMLYENASEIMVTAQEISAAWDPDGLICNTNSCTAGFVNTNGDKVQVRTTLYSSADAAKSAYNSEKQKDSGYRIVPLEIPDESYSWIQKSQSKVVFQKNNMVVIVNYTTNSGMASIEMAKEFALKTSQNL